jgi:hypothetical protein
MRFILLTHHEDFFGFGKEPPVAQTEISVAARAAPDHSSISAYA